MFQNLNPYQKYILILLKYSLKAIVRRNSADLNMKLITFLINF